MPAMGIYDRDYYRASLPRGGFGHFSAWSVTTWLIVVNVVVFFIEGALSRGRGVSVYDLPEGTSLNSVLLSLMGPLERWGYFSTQKAIFGGQVWRFLTFQFLHASGWHLLGNMVGIGLFGPIVEAQFGRARFFAFYLLCGLAGAFCYLLLSFGHILLYDPATPMVGASAGVFGLLVAAALIAPGVELFSYIMPVTIGMIAICGVIVAAYSVISLGPNAGGEAGHLGGGLFGFILMKNQHLLHAFELPRRPRVVVGSPRRKRRRRVLQKDWSKDFNR